MCVCVCVCSSMKFYHVYGFMQPPLPWELFVIDAGLFTKESDCPGNEAISHFDFQKLIWEK